MDELKIENARESMFKLLQRSIDHPELDKLHAERIRRKNGDLYNRFYAASKLAASSLLPGIIDRETEAAVLNDFTMAYHVYEEVTSQRIPHIDNLTLNKIGEDILEGRVSRKEHLEEIIRTNPIYAEYIGRVMLSWQDHLPIQNQVLQGCIDYLVLIPFLVIKQNQKK